MSTVRNAVAANDVACAIALLNPETQLSLFRNGDPRKTRNLFQVFLEGLGSRTGATGLIAFSFHSLPADNGAV